MFLLRLKRFLAEREILVGIVILGLLAMIADIAADWKQGLFAAVIVRIVACVALLVLLLLDIWVLRRQQSVPVPLVITEETNREAARDLFTRFVENVQLTKSLKVIERLSRIRRDDLLIRLDRFNPRLSEKPEEWKAAWWELLQEWEREIDKRLLSWFANETRCYHILPHVVLPLAFALGASVGLRRSIVIYHRQEERFGKVLNLVEPRHLFEEPPQSTQQPDRAEEIKGSNKLILHLVITDRHIVQFKNHPDFAQSTNVTLSYSTALPVGDWLPYTQHLVRNALSLIGNYEQVEICLLCPSAIAFALGMAFSRSPRIAVCHWINNKYVPVFSLREIEQHLSFD